MPLDLSRHRQSELIPGTLRALVQAHHAKASRRHLLWSYYRNPMQRHDDGPGQCGDGGSRRTRLAQERGLPARLTERVLMGTAASNAALSPIREIVIENDISWRIGTMIDFLFGRPLRIRSRATSPELSSAIEQALAKLWSASGGMTLLQDAAVLGHVYGNVQFTLAAANQTTQQPEDLAIALASPERTIAVFSAGDYRKLVALILLHPGSPDAPPRSGSTTALASSVPDVKPSQANEGFGSRLLRMLRRRAGDASSRSIASLWPASRRTSDDADFPGLAGYQVQIISASADELYQVDDRGDAHLLHSAPPLCPGTLPACSVANTVVPMSVEGLGEVEPLIPLQDELNTRLSDRANRVTLQSFKMYLAKGIEGFDRVPVAPGTIWHTENLDASITAFGGDADSPSEDQHIAEVREAMDKLSSTPPLAAGVVNNKIGNLTSENALRVTLQGILARTERKRLTYGRGILAISQAALAAFDHAGILKTTAAERELEILWPDPLPPVISGAMKQSPAAASAALDPTLGGSAGGASIQ